MILSDLGLDDITLAAALLHDAVEDTSLKLDQIREAGASERVLAGIEAITHEKTMPAEAYWAQVRANPDALQVKLADIRDNLDPARLELLSAEKAEGLRRKYARALTTLLGATAPAHVIEPQ